MKAYAHVAVSRCRQPHSSRSLGFGRTDLLVLAAILFLVLLVALPTMAGRRDRSDRVSCINNLRTLGQAFLSWSEDHNEQFQFRTPVIYGGSQGLTTVGEHLRVLSNYLSSPNPLSCPGIGRPPAATFAGLRNANVSYSLAVHGQPVRPQAMLSADWDMEGGSSRPCSVPGQVTVDSFDGSPGLASTFTAGWSTTNHGRSGQVLTCDGAVQMVDGAGLRRALSRSPLEKDTTEHLLTPR